MARRTISVPGLGHGRQPIPFGVAVGPIFVTGSISGIDADSGLRPTEAAEEFDHAFRNAERALVAAGLGMGDVAKVEVTLADAADRDLLNQVWVRWFPDEGDRPVRHTGEAPLPRGLRIQLSLLAATDPR